MPKALCSGDLVRVIAPAGPFDRALFYRGLSWLSERFRVIYDRGVFQRSGLFAGDDSRRLNELNAALRCPQTAAIIAARGGAGCSRIAPAADFAALRQYPKWLVGFSDVTALHVEAQAVGVASLHAHNLTGLGRSHMATRTEWLQALSAPHEAPPQTPLEMLTPGSAQGPVVGGNLALVHNAVAAGRWHSVPGAILFFEEVAEACYRIDRMLVALEQAGVFRTAAAVLVGDITECDVGQAGVSARDVFASLGARTSLPVAWGFPAGHGVRNVPLILGQRLNLDLGLLTLAQRV